MSCFLALTLAAGSAVVSTAALAATTKERVRGEVTSIGGDMLTVHSTGGWDVPVTLSNTTHYLKLAKSNLDHVDPGIYIGTETEDHR